MIFQGLKSITVKNINKYINMKINFKEGDIVLRKGKRAKIVKIYLDMNPPSVDVLMIGSGNFVNTEFGKIGKIDKLGKKKRKKGKKGKKN